MAGVDSALTTHGDHHAGDIGTVDIGGQNFPHLSGAQVVVIVREEEPGFLLVADEAVDLLQEIPALHGNAHVGDCRKNFFIVLFGKAEHLLDGIFFEIQLQRNAVTVLEDLIALFFQQAGEGAGVRPLGDGGADVAVVVKDSQPGAHTIRYRPDVLRVDLVGLQLVDDILADAGVIYQTDERGPQLHIGNVLRHVAAHTAVHLLYPAGIPSARDIGGEGIALDVHKHRANYNDSHSVFLSCSDSDYLYCIGFAGRGQEQRAAKSTRSPKAPRAVGIRI